MLGQLYIHRNHCTKVEITFVVEKASAHTLFAPFMEFKKLGTQKIIHSQYWWLVINKYIGYRTAKSKPFIKKTKKLKVNLRRISYEIAFSLLI